MTNSLCPWTVSFLARKTMPGRPVEDRPRRVTEGLTIGAAHRGRCFLFHVCCSVYPPQAFGLVGSPTTEQRLRCIVFFFI